MGKGAFSNHQSCQLEEGREGSLQEVAAEEESFVREVVMASREVKPAFSEKMRSMERMAPKGKVRAALTPPKEERGKKETRKPKRAIGR